MSFLRHPRRLWVRRLAFQVHLVAGLILAIYVSLIGATGAILVFGAELSPGTSPATRPVVPNQPMATLELLISHLRQRYPYTHVVSLIAPTQAEPAFLATLQSRRRFTVVCDPISGRVLNEVHASASKLEWVYDLHENLLAGRKGRIVNGTAALALLLVIVTGLISWWPGLASWRRGLTIDFQRRWKRINFDLHSAAGFWSFSFLAMWSLSGAYFTWPDRVTALVNRVSPVVNSRPPVISVTPDEGRVDFDAMLAKAHAVDPAAIWKGLIFLASRHSPFALLMARSASPWRDDEDTLYFNPYNGRYLGTWRYGVNKSLSDWFLWLQMPLHFGTHWGLAVKFVWALFGLSLPLLAVTGITMYWNRALSKQWKR